MESGLQFLFRLQKPETRLTINHNIKKIGIVHSDAQRKFFLNEKLFLTEKEAEKEAKIIAKYLVKMGYETFLFPANESLIENLRKKKPDFIFNLTGSVNGIDYLASAIPGILEMLKIPFSGSTILGEALAYNKFLVKQLMRNLGISVPNHQLFITEKDPIKNLKFPVISKLNEIHGSVDINANAVSENEKELRKRLKYLIDTYHQGILVEEFIQGPEATAIVLEGGKQKVFLAEKVFSSKKQKYQLAGFDCQWKDDSKTGFDYQKITDKKLTKIIEEAVMKAFKHTGMRSFAKFDIKFSKNAKSLPRYYIIDANSNPAFGPKEECDIAISNVLHLYGIDFFEILRRIISSANQ